MESKNIRGNILNLLVLSAYLGQGNNQYPTKKPLRLSCRINKSHREQ